MGIAPQDVLQRHRIQALDIPPGGFLLADGADSWIVYPAKDGTVIVIRSPFQFVAAYGTRMPIPWTEIFHFTFDTGSYNGWNSEEETLERFREKTEAAGFE